MEAMNQQLETVRTNGHPLVQLDIVSLYREQEVRHRAFEKAMTASPLVTDWSATIQAIRHLEQLASATPIRR